MNELRLHLAEESIPLPRRPGSMWDMDPQSGRCKRCGKGYNSHGAPASDAAAFGIPEQRRHLLCPATDEEWDKYRRAVGARSVSSYVEMVKIDLAKFTIDQQISILNQLLAWAESRRAEALPPCEICTAGIPNGYFVCPSCGRK